ncbi:toxic anion resistance protein [Alteromonas macleodii]|uniref:Toxic anion resistance family protein n=1 Tax=Alteromonas macleodii TaxID=28108 RepID=A0AB36FNJ3_ALTMA|nr:toxic anion resistance protein [Alteromonas macleodii]OES23931.1 toxic anion resistance family protein [Alteromonas macleodii]OES24109.1 toxic anion resistance family protein [Alteromonas macleodii]OES25036.1 toxic anion resistance family protein [Alteromonas macleodii]OES38696.1 toxic anion resistance family protein [Alteromonas macleodii]
MQTQTSIATAPDLTELGLSETDMPAVMEIRDSLGDATKHDIVTYGSEAAQKAATYADDLLSHNNMTDIAVANEQFAQVTSLANSIDLKALTQNPVIWPVIGDIMRFALVRTVVRKFGTTKHEITSQFNSAKGQMDELVKDLSGTQTNLKSRNEQYETMYEAVNAEYHKLARYIAAAQMHVGELKAEQERMQALATNEIDSHRLHDLSETITQWEKRIANLSVLQQSAFQTLPTIRIVQGNNLALVEKFETITSLTIPLWKKQFMIQLGMNEQKNAVQLADAIDETTNRMLIEGADLLKQNTIATAKSNKRLSIDVNTLQHVQDRLLETMKETTAINAQAQTDYEASTKAITNMRDTFKAQLVEQAALDSKSVH